MILALRVGLAVSFAAMLLAQVAVLPREAADTAAAYPEAAFMKLPVLVFCVLIVACAELVVACIWVLLTMVTRDAIFTQKAIPWVDRMIAAILAAFILVVATFGYMTYHFIQFLVPGLIAALTVLSLASLLVVMRQLLRNATTLRDEMEQVL